MKMHTLLVVIYFCLLCNSSISSIHLKKQPKSQIKPDLEKSGKVDKVKKTLIVSQLNEIHKTIKKISDDYDTKEAEIKKEYKEKLEKLEKENNNNLKDTTKLHEDSLEQIKRNHKKQIEDHKTQLEKDDEEVKKLKQSYEEQLIDLTITRIMKGRIGKDTKHNELMTEICKQIEMFVPKIDQIKNRIENLINRKVIQRNHEFSDMYEYVS